MKRTDRQEKYPDMREIFKAKDAQRRALAALPWEEKIRIVEKMMRENPGRKWRDRGIVSTHP